MPARLGPELDGAGRGSCARRVQADGHLGVAEVDAAALEAQTVDEAVERELHRGAGRSALSAGAAAESARGGLQIQRFTAAGGLIAQNVGYAVARVADRGFEQVGPLGAGGAGAGETERVVPEFDEADAAPDAVGVGPGRRGWRRPGRAGASCEEGEGDDDEARAQRCTHDLDKVADATRDRERARR